MFNWVDLIIILVLIYFALETAGKPFILELINLAGFILAFFLSFKYYALAATALEKIFPLPHSLSLVLGFTLAWFIAETLFYFLIRTTLPKLPQIKLTAADTLSFIPGMLRGLIYVALFLVLLATFPIQPNLKKAVQDSKVGNLILQNSYQLERPIKSVFGDLSNESLSFLTIEPKSNERVSLGFQTNQFSIDEAAEEAMIALVNQERASRGLSTLGFDAKLRAAARNHSADMFKRGYFSHYSPEGESVVKRAEKYQIDYLVIGENLAYAPSLQLAHQGLMNSPGHRANILSPDFHKIGVGVMDGGVYGKMFTQVFTN